MFPAEVLRPFKNKAAAHNSTYSLQAGLPIFHLPLSLLLEISHFLTSFLRARIFTILGKQGDLSTQP
jgi:hypothetical protein